MKKPLHTPLNFNNTNVKQTAFQKHLGLILVSQLSFERRLKTIFNRDFIFENYYKRIGFSKENGYYSMKRLKKKRFVVTCEQINRKNN